MNKYKLPTIKNKIDFKKVYNDSQEYMKNTEWSFDFNDIYDFIRLETNEFQNENDRLINLDGVIYDIIVEYANDNNIDLGITQEKKPKAEPKKEEKSEEQLEVIFIGRLNDLKQKALLSESDELKDNISENIEMFEILIDSDDDFESNTELQENIDENIEMFEMLLM